MNAAEDDTPSGDSLRAARRVRNLSVAKAAEELRLTPDQIEFLEAGQYDRLGPAVFARGHLRRYAALVGLPAEPFLEAYETEHRGDPPPTLVPPASVHTPVTGRRNALARALAILVPAALAAIVAGAWWLQRDGELPRSDRGPVDTAAEDQSPVEAVSGQAAASGPQVGEAAPAGLGADRLAFSFSGPCWIEVYDANGERLAYQLAQPGTTLTFPGPAPWRVVLGNVSAARVSVDGRTAPLSGEIALQNTASVYVDEAGTVARVPAAPRDET